MIEYITPNQIPPLIAAGVTAVIVIIVGLALVRAVPGRLSEDGIVWVALAILMGVVLSGGTAYLFTNAVVQREAVTAFCTEATELYGIDLLGDGDNRCNELRYPWATPTEDFEVFGSFELQERTGEGSFNSQTIHLVWDNGNLYLATADEGATEYTALETK